MIKEFEPIVMEILQKVESWETKFSTLPDAVISERRNVQNRTIRQILGHLADSASNNIHRIVHLQHRESPLDFPNYASEGNNDRWMAIQNYQEEEWYRVIQYWKYTNLHLVHVIGNIDPAKLEQAWIASPGRNIPLRVMVTDYVRHLNLHLDEIDELLKEQG